MRIFEERSLVVLLLVVLMGSCVPAKQFSELKDKNAKCEEERNTLMESKQDLETQNNEMSAELESLRKKVDLLVSDTAIMGTTLQKMRRQYENINKLNDELLRKQADLLGKNSAENAKLVAELQALQDRLLKKEDALKELEAELNKKERNLDNLSSELVKRENRVKELENIIAAQDSAVNALKQRISDALLGFKDKGLNVEQRNGKIYVSMEAKLLFASGSTVVDPEGKRALVELAKVLRDQKDIGILVEGHTDTDKMKSATIKDNWDLSVMRATSVVRIMKEEGKLDPNLITAAGRGEFAPVDTGKTAAAKAKNRRIEVILTPNLDKLFQILEN